MHKLTIFLVTNNFHPYNAGVVKSIELLQSSLQEAGHTAFIIAPDFTNVPDENPFIIRLYCPIKFKYYTKHMAIPWAATAQLVKLMGKYKPDIVHVQHPFLLGPAALTAARKNNIPVLFTYHSQYEAYSHYIPAPQQLVKKIVSITVKRFCNAVDGIIVPTTTIQTRIAGITKKPIAVIPTAIRKEFFDNTGRLPARPLKLLSVGRFEKEKNIPFLLRTLKLLKHQEFSFSLTLAGFGSELESLKEFAFGTLQLPQNQLFFVDKPLHEQLLALYRTADLFVFASKTETQGIVLAEAMASGLPVIAVDAQGSNDIVVNGKNGFLVNTESEMAERVAQMQNHHVYQLLSASAMQTAAQHYRSDQFINAVTEFYAKIMTK